MLSDIIKQSSGWDTKALAEIFSNKKFLRSVDGDKEKYLADLISKDYEKRNITLPREIIPDSVTLDALYFTHKKDPLTLPILLRYFTHKNLLQEAKDDLDKLNQKLQGAMDKDLKDLQDKKAKLQANETDLNDKKIQGKEAKALAYDIQKINAEITEASSEIEKIKSYKKDIETLFKGGKVELSSYPQKYSFILERELTKVMEEKLAHYIKDNTNIEKTYSSLNSKRKKIIMLKNIQDFSALISFVPLFVSLMAELMIDPATISLTSCCIYFLVIPLSISATFLAIAGAAYLMLRHYEQSFVKEMQDFIEGPKYVDKATNTEDVKKLEQEETGVGDYGKKPSAPPYDGPKQPGLYPDLSEAQPPSYEEACGTIVQLEDSGPSSNLDSAEQLKPGTDLLGSLSEQQNAKLGPVLLPSNTM
ncbi:hypothetical protein [Wolbachia endosymbiont (group A) of Bibio marci]|uniref:hypothetical protein n=1 Tax=Wolbachia endosymbiont (group A) of Bibio marci TaxID=2953987 RepID=UPI002230F2B3|nr:hypothetical protein [Wolbachia endosymbiont (group A) of Bibio marci]